MCNCLFVITYFKLQEQSYWSSPDKSLYARLARGFHEFQYPLVYRLFRDVNNITSFSCQPHLLWLFNLHIWTLATSLSFLFIPSHIILFFISLGSSDYWSLFLPPSLPLLWNSLTFLSQCSVQWYFKIPKCGRLCSCCSR